MVVRATWRREKLPESRRAIRDGRMRRRKISDRATARWDDAVIALKHEEKESRLRAGESLESNYDRADVAQRRAIYRMGRSLILNGDESKVILAKVLTDRLKIPNKSPEINFFFWLLVGLDDEGYTFSRSQRTRLAQNMQYAHLHDIPPEIFEGFIMQVGKDSVPAKLKNNVIMPWTASLAAR